MTGDRSWRAIGGARPSPLLCVCDHASNAVPPDIDLGIDPALLDTHIALDIAAAGVTENLARAHGIPAHLATVSRLVCDLHRREDEAGVVPVASDGHPIPGNAGADVALRLARFHRPYHAALDAMIDAVGPAMLLAIHSFTPKLATSEAARPWEVALLYNRDDRAARPAIRLFRERGFTVGDNQPYSGKLLNATMDRHAEARGLPYLTIEIRNDQIATAAGQARWADLIADIAQRVLLALARP